MLIIPMSNEEEDPGAWGDPAVLHPNCFEGVYQELFKQEATTIIQIGIGSVQDIWAGLNTESDEEAGIED